MRKLLATIALAVGFTVSSWTGHAEAKNPECRFGLGVRAMRQTIWCVSHKLHESGGFRRFALYVADRESHFDAGARNTRSWACGIYQHIPRYWPDRYATYRMPVRFGRTNPSCYSGRTNIIVGLGMAHRGGWSPWS